MCRELVLSFHIYVGSRDWIQATKLQFYLPSYLAVALQFHAPQLDSWESKKKISFKISLVNIRNCENNLFMQIYWHLNPVSKGIEVYFMFSVWGKASGDAMC